MKHTHHLHQQQQHTARSGHRYTFSHQQPDTQADSRSQQAEDADFTSTTTTIQKSKKSFYRKEQRSVDIVVSSDWSNQATSNPRLYFYQSIHCFVKWDEEDHSFYSVIVSLFK